MKNKKIEKNLRLHEKATRVLQLIKEVEFRIVTQKFTLSNYEINDDSRNWYVERISINKAIKKRLISAYKNLNSKN